MYEEIQLSPEAEQRIELLRQWRDILDRAIYLEEELPRVIAERDHYRKAYSQSLSDGIKHSEAMMGNVLKVMLNRDLMGADCVIAVELPKEPTA